MNKQIEEMLGYIGHAIQNKPGNFTVFYHPDKKGRLMVLEQKEDRVNAWELRLIYHGPQIRGSSVIDGN